MITEVITFKLRPGMTREDVVAVYRTTAPILARQSRVHPQVLPLRRRAAAGRRRLPVEEHRGGEEGARRGVARDDQRLYGSEDEISIVYFETPVVADNLVQQTIEDVEPVAPASVG
jgi:hypothetical protein